MEKISFINPISDKGALKRIRRNTDITIVASRSEGLGRTTIEGMLAGTLVIGANAGATPEIIMDGYNGYLYNVNDPKNLSDIISNAIDNKDIAIKIAERGQKDAMQRFNRTRYGIELLEIYKELVTNE